MLTRTALLAALNSIRYPHPADPAHTKGLADSAAILVASACDGLVAIRIAAAGLSEQIRLHLRTEVTLVVRQVADRAGDPVRTLNIEMAEQAPGTAAGASPRTIPLAATAPAAKPAAKPAPTDGPATQAQPRAGSKAQASAISLPNIKHIIAVGAGKGGVGKSTIAVNLAVGLALRGHAVGLLDGDIYGPSLPTMMGLHGLPANLLGNMLQPFYVHGVKVMTIGKLVDAEKPLIWRGPMAHGAFKQLVDQTEWGELDFLIIDLPPGTGDVALTMAQMLKLTGAVIVCTPQQVAQDDAIRALRMFEQLRIEVLGVVENMSYFVADDITPPREYDIFGRGGAQQLAQRTGVPFLGAVPITISLRKNSDDGNPSANFQGTTPLAASLDRLVQNLQGQVSLASLKTGQSTPTLTIS